MTIQNLMQKKNLTKYRLSKNSGIPYITLTDICSDKAQLEWKKLAAMQSLSF